MLEIPDLTKVKNARRATPRRTLLYGTHGIGKSTWAASWPKPICLPTEDGLADIDVDAFPLVKHYPQALGAVESLITGKHDYKTLIVDSLDWLEQIIFKSVAEKHSKKTVAEVDYGRGYVEAATMLKHMLAGFDRCRDDRGMHVVLLAHSDIVKFESPDGDTYDRYGPALNKKHCAPLVQQWCDEVLFAHYKTFTRKTDEGFGRSRAIGTGGKRVVETQEKPAFLAKSRLDLPEEMPLDFNEYKKFLTPSSNGAKTK